MCIYKVYRMCVLFGGTHRMFFCALDKPYRNPKLKIINQSTINQPSINKPSTNQSTSQLINHRPFNHQPINQPINHQVFNQSINQPSTNQPINYQPQPSTHTMHKYTSGTSISCPGSRGNNRVFDSCDEIIKKG